MSKTVLPEDVVDKLSRARASRVQDAIGDWETEDINIVLEAINAK